MKVMTKAGIPEDQVWLLAAPEIATAACSGGRSASPQQPGGLYFVGAIGAPPASRTGTSLPP
jgi:hypothetical protein